MSGGVTFNDCIMHHITKDAPFGGVGHSGTGYYHGAYGIDSFSHLRTYIDLPSWMDKAMAFRYPPYTDSSTKKATDGRVRKAWFTREGEEQRSGSWIFWKS
jgi:aldehyde dehydrogenase (NAD+)